MLGGRSRVRIARRELFRRASRRELRPRAVVPGRPTATERDADMATNFERLREAGLIRQPLPEPHRAVIDELDPAHIDVLLEIKNKVEDADRSFQLAASPSVARYIIY